MNHQRCPIIFLEAQGVKRNVKGLSLRLTHILSFLCHLSCFTISVFCFMFQCNLR